LVLNKYERFAYRRLGPYVKKSADANAHLSLALRKANIQMRPEVYLATSYMNMLIAFLSTLALLLVSGILYLFGVAFMGAGMFLLLVPLPLLLAMTIYLVTFVMPDLRAGQRAKDIEAKLPYALSFISTMASAGVTPQGIFASLAKQPIYGEVAKEAALISRDLEILGRDVITALTEAIDRSPSIRFQDLLQGAITTLSSGGDIKHYFLAKSEQYVYDNRQLQRRFLDNLSVMAESFVTVVVAAPLFLIVLLSVAITFGGNGENLLNIGYILVLVLLPLAQAAFALSIQSMTPEV
jgi:archaeal flagellar protein FlaJ